jgi:hypothetical protein
MVTKKSKALRRAAVSLIAALALAGPAYAETGATYTEEERSARVRLENSVEMWHYSGSYWMAMFDASTEKI